MVQRQSITHRNGPKSTDSGFEIAEEKIRMEIAQATNRIKKLKSRRDSLPARMTVADAQKDQKMMKLSTKRKHLTNVLKMVAYQTESDLVELIRPHYNRVEDEGRTFIQMALQDTADIEPAVDQLRIIASPTQFDTSVTCPRSPLRDTQQDEHAISGHPASNALCGRTRLS